MHQNGNILRTVVRQFEFCYAFAKLSVDTFLTLEVSSESCCRIRSCWQQERSRPSHPAPRCALGPGPTAIKLVVVTTSPTLVSTELFLDSISAEREYAVASRELVPAMRPLPPRRAYTTFPTTPHKIHFLTLCLLFIHHIIHKSIGT
jgi:hypothetical protein